MTRNKKGLSEIIGYVLLIVIAISLSLLVYAWMKGILLKKTNECPDGASLLIEDYSCIQEQKMINITFKNRGLFNISGFVIKIANETGHLAIYPLRGVSPMRGEEGEEGRFFFTESLKPNEKFINIFTYEEHDKILEIELIPSRFQEEYTLCDKSAIKQEIEGCE